MFLKQAMTKPTVLITGCSDGGLGSALALAFHAQGRRVFATARSPSKLAQAKAAGVEILTLDVTSSESIEKCVNEVRNLTGGSLDMLVNNAGASYAGPLADASLDKCKKLFELNVWANLATAQAFLPLLLKSATGGMVVNHTSIASTINPPFVSVYAASKAALATITASLRAELSPFNVKVVDLKTGCVSSNIYDNQHLNTTVSQKSLYYAARDLIEFLINGKAVTKEEIPAEMWAKQVVAALTQRKPPNEVWVGGNAWLAWFGSCMPKSVADMITWNIAQMGTIRKNISEYGRDRAIMDAYGEK